ncbi:hypothetical protein ACG1BZ_12460 [Microbulbifer sp. CNSA002]
MTVRGLDIAKGPEVHTNRAGSVIKRNVAAQSLKNGRLKIED